MAAPAIPLVLLLEVAAELAGLARDALKEGRTTVELTTIGQRHRLSAEMLTHYLAAKDLARSGESP